MEKLIHERLREYDEQSCSFICDNGRSVTGLWNSEANSIADEIEKYYIPRPRFENGEPVQFGDDIEIYNRTGLLDSGTIQSFHPNNGSVWMLSLVGVNHERLVRFDPGTCVIKRPESKVLDADGVEIKVGDTVWDLDSGEKLTVVEFANREHGIIQCSNEEDEYYSDHDAHRLTHREPDSLKKLRDDTTKPPRQYYADFIGHDVGLKDDEEINSAVHKHIIDRVVAIMERDA